EEKGEETYLYSDYRYYVPKDEKSLTLYRYSYELDEGEEWQSKIKEDVSYSDSSYKEYSSLSERTYLSYYYGETAWTTVDDLKDWLGDGSLEVKKKNKETVYKITETEEEKTSGTEGGEKYSYGEKITYVLEFHVNSKGYVTEYTETGTYSEEGTEGEDSWSEEVTWSDNYTISYSFDDKLKLAEKEMEEYTEK
ncbi:MAG: hypothetical protein LUD29_01720, partial [Clostridia bacterium]|nr:hypothetical protein [Clostridia bacterium]